MERSKAIIEPYSHCRNEENVERLFIYNVKENL